MKQIVKLKNDVNQILTKDGMTTLSVKCHYFDEYGNEIFPKINEEYIMPDGSIKKF